MGFRKWKLKAIWFSAVKTLKTHRQRNKHKSLPWSYTCIWDLSRSCSKNHSSLKMNSLFTGRFLLLRVKHKGFNTFPGVQKRDCTGNNIEKENNWETFWIAFITTDYLDPWRYICALLPHEQLFWNVEEKIVQAKIKATILLWNVCIQLLKNCNRLQMSTNERMLKSIG